jgi:hypothetical protein
MPKQSKAQKDVMERVMHEFKEGELETGTGAKVKSRRQAVAIGLSESGASNQQSPKENKRNLSRTNARERKGETGAQRKEGGGETRAELYERAKKQNVEGRSKMSKAELEQALKA